MFLMEGFTMNTTGKTRATVLEAVGVDGKEVRNV